MDKPEVELPEEEKPDDVQAADAKSDGLVRLNPGDAVGPWTVEGKLGEGAFGAVYKVNRGKQGYAMKTESKGLGHNKLKIEVYVLRKANAIKSPHFCTCYDTGSYGDIHYIVMTMIGFSLQDLKKKQPERKFSMGCALSIGVQTVIAIQHLHKIGYLHRDIKPDNFACGVKELGEARKIYMLDFGLCRQYLDDKGQIRKPRRRARFQGTVRYAPLSSHIRREYSRKDDLEGWLYQQVELTRGALPWRSTENQLEVANYKERCRFDPGVRELMGGCPIEYIEIMRYIDTLRYYDKPNYHKIRDLLKQAMKIHAVQEFPYDWERKDTNTSSAPSKNN